ncbi:MAG TPA: hypothetical protein VMW58_12425 [Anaerolineae bacterium]|nr:hypothetical protein [Anaerolineae bacterium]
MATTNLIVDYLVIGTASLAWGLPVLLALAGTDWLSSVAKAGVVGAVVLVGSVYVLGICISRVADWLTDGRNDRIRDEVFGPRPQLTYHNRVNFVVAKSESASEYLSYRRSIVRISRSCAVQFAAGCAAWPLAACVGAGGVSLLAGGLGAVICGAASYVMWVGWQLVLKGYFGSVKDMYDSLSDSG